VDYCKYHPLAPATYLCHDCAIHQCDQCVDDDPKHRSGARCFLCGAVLESLGSGNTVEPFWRRLPEAFKYPVNSASMSLIVGMSIVSVLATLMPFLFILAIFLYLFAVGAVLKYSFTCLEHTAMGDMKAPDVMDAYHGGIKLLFQLVFITIIMLLVVGAAVKYIGLAMGGLLGVIAVVSYPAILISLAQTQSAVEAINPLRALALIGAIGLPYGLLIAFIMMMMTSVAVLNEWIGTYIPAVSYLLQTIVSNYYTIVVFHLMGYMLFQYQGKLGYSARIDDDENEQAQRTDTARYLAKIDVLLKEGEYEQMVDGYYRMFKQFPAESVFYDNYFELLYACKKSTLMADFAGLYLEFMFKKKRYDKITATFKKILLVTPDYIPGSPGLRLEIARLLTQQGDNKLAIKLVNGLHKQHPEFAGLVDAYQLMAGLLDEVPGMQAQAEKCRQLIEQIKRKNAEKLTAPKTVVTEKPTPATQPGKPLRQPPPRQSSGLALELVPMEPITPLKPDTE
jgi:tetratricopeptide (TPR) repeat protein